MTTSAASIGAARWPGPTALEVERDAPLAPLQERIGVRFQAGPLGGST
jgi:hypothetical protein